jgi:dTDP-4-amino-4,6-dideoxygalactose transaminase
MNNTPALFGGAKAKQTPYGVGDPRYGDDELRELQEALAQNTLFYAQGKKVKLLEAEFAEKYGAKHAITCTSGTAAIHTALMAVGVSPGDEVIVPPITDMGTISPVLFQGAIPVFADLTPHGYTLDPESVAARITSRTRAIVAVHLWGNTCDLDALQALCDRHGIALIEDAAQAFGATYKGCPVGTRGAVGCFSFNEFKHISCGDGGLVLTDDDTLAEKLRLATDKGYNRRPDALVRQPEFLANNYRMTELQGAVARAQLRKLDGIVERRRRWCNRLTAKLIGTPGIALPEATHGANPSWWFYLLRVVPETLGTDADGLTKALTAEGVRAGAHYIGDPIYRYPIFQKKSAFAHAPHACDTVDWEAQSCLVAEAILETGVMIPVNEANTDTDADEVALAIRKIAAWYGKGGA